MENRNTKRVLILKKLFACGVILLLMAGCDSQPDTSYIQNYEQFIQACTFCKPCNKDSRPIGCVNEGNHCVPLCSGDHVWMTGFKGELEGCRCTGTNKMWVFSNKTKAVELRRVPLDEYGNEIN